MFVTLSERQRHAYGIFQNLACVCISVCSEFTFVVVVVVNLYML